MRGLFVSHCCPGAWRVLFAVDHCCCEVPVVVLNTGSPLNHVHHSSSMAMQSSQRQHCNSFCTIFLINCNVTKNPSLINCNIMIKWDAREGASRAVAVLTSLLFPPLASPFVPLNQSCLSIARVPALLISINTQKNEMVGARGMGGETDLLRVLLSYLCLFLAHNYPPVTTTVVQASAQADFFTTRVEARAFQKSFRSPVHHYARLKISEAGHGVVMWIKASDISKEAFFHNAAPKLRSSSIQYPKSS